LGGFPTAAPRRRKWSQAAGHLPWLRCRHLQRQCSPWVITYVAHAREACASGWVNIAGGYCRANRSWPSVQLIAHSGRGDHRGHGGCGISSFFPIHRLAVAAHRFRTKYQAADISSLSQPRTSSSSTLTFLGVSRRLIDLGPAGRSKHSRHRQSCRPHRPSTALCAASRVAKPTSRSQRSHPMVELRHSRSGLSCSSKANGQIGKRFLPGSPRRVHCPAPAIGHDQLIRTLRHNRAKSLLLASAAPSQRRANRAGDH